MKFILSSVREKEHMPYDMHVTLELEEEDLIGEDTITNPIELLNLHFAAKYNYTNYKVTYVASAKHNQDNSWSYTAFLTKKYE